MMLCSNDLALVWFPSPRTHHAQRLLVIRLGGQSGPQNIATSKKIYICSYHPQKKCRQAMLQSMTIMTHDNLCHICKHPPTCSMAPPPFKSPIRVLLLAACAGAGEVHGEHHGQNFEDLLADWYPSRASPRFAKTPRVP